MTYPERSPGVRQAGLTAVQAAFEGTGTALPARGPGAPQSSPSDTLQAFPHLQSSHPCRLLQPAPGWGSPAGMAEIVSAHLGRLPGKGWGARGFPPRGFPGPHEKHLPGPVREKGAGSRGVFSCVDACRAGGGTRLSLACPSQRAVKAALVTRRSAPRVTAAAGNSLVLLKESQAHEGPWRPL